jgi:hypothetical protein
LQQARHGPSKDITIFAFAGQIAGQTCFEAFAC